MNWPAAPLGDLCEMDRQGLQPDEPDARSLPFVGVENVESGSGVINFGNDTRVGSQKSTTFRFDERHVLYGKLRPYLNKVATPTFSGKCSTELVPLLPRAGVDREFLGYLLRRNETVEYVMSSVAGARMPRTDMKALMSLSVPFPPLEEQRRTVGILNWAAKIERLRKQAQERLREFIPAQFVKMFGDPTTNPMGWPLSPLGEVIRVSSGRGLSAKHMRPGIFAVYGGNGIAGYHSDFMFDEPKIVIGRVGANCGAILLSRPKSWITDNALYVREIRRPVTTIYLEWALRMANLNQYAGKAAQPLISGSRIYPVLIMLPDKVMQRKFVQFVEAAGSSSELVMSAAGVADKFTKSLMSRFLGASS